MLKRIRIKDLKPADDCYINGHRFKIYGKVIRDDKLLIVIYQDRLNHRRQLSYVDPDMEVLIDGTR